MIEYGECVRLIKNVHYIKGLIDGSAIDADISNEAANMLGEIENALISCSKEKEGGYWVDTKKETEQ